MRVDDTRWGGYLANVGCEAFRQFEQDIPEALDGDAFLARYDGTTDLVTRVDPARRYAIRVPNCAPDLTRHERVTEWARLLTASPPAAAQPDAARLGARM